MIKLLSLLTFALTILHAPQNVEAQAPTNEADRKLRDAFGPDSTIVRNAKIKLELSMDKGETIYVFACREFTILDNGKIKLTPGHYACYVKEKDKKSFRASSTGQSSSAELTFDRPVKTIEEMQKAQLKQVFWPGVLTSGAKKK